MKNYCRIIQLIFKIYKNQYFQLLDTRLKRFSVLFACLAWLGLSTLVSLAMTKNFVGLFFEGALRQMYMGILVLAISETSLVLGLFIVLRFFWSDEDKLLTVLGLTTVPRKTYLLAYQSAQLLLNVVIPVIIYGIIALPNLIIYQSHWRLLLSVLVIFVFQAVFVVMLIHLLYNVLNYLAHKLALPYAENMVYGTLTLIFMTSGGLLFERLTQVLQGIQYYQFNIFYAQVGYLASFWDLDLQGYSPLVLTVINLMLAYLLYSSVRLVALTEKKAYHSRLLKQVEQGQGYLRTWLLKDIKLISRSELTQGLIVVVYLINGIFASFGRLPDVAAIIDAGCIGSIAFIAFGQEQQMLAVYKLLGLAPSRVLISKALASLVVANLVYLPLGLTIAPTHFWSNSLCLVVVLLLVFGLGVLFPYDRARNLSQVSMLLAFLAGFFVLPYLIQGVMSLSLVVKILVIVLGVLSLSYGIWQRYLKLWERSCL